MKWTHPEIAPPWVLFTDDGKPIAIMPAGRPGEVANVEGMTLAEAGEIVALANRINDVVTDSAFRRIDESLAELQRVLDAGRDEEEPGR